MRRDRSLHAVMEAALANLETDDATWLASVASALEGQAGDGYGCVAAMYGPTEESIGFDVVFGPDMPSGLEARAVFEATTQGAPDYTRRVYSELAYGTTSGIGPVCERLFHTRVHDFGIRDAICVNASLGGHKGAAFLISQPRRRRLRMSEHAWLSDVSALLTLVIQKRGGARSTRPLPPQRSPSTDGYRELRLPDETARLRAAGFQPVREIDEDGQRRVVVEPLTLGALALLSSRERAAVLALRTDTSNKEIADVLGTSSSTVGVLLHRAAAKLGARSRAELIAIATRARNEH